ncbi:hypothetical protein [Streptomyces virginiae]|uniref:hypothetical protein n=1 Tax=Streptomyces virginiae TaxID=1961 RepID=UPI00342495DD
MHRRGARTVLRGPRRSNAPGLPGGRAPYGYDAATLYLYALLIPETAARIRNELAPVLDRPEARTGLLTVCAQVLQAQDRIDFYAEIANPVREHLARL